MASEPSLAQGPCFGSRFYRRFKSCLANKGLHCSDAYVSTEEQPRQGAGGATKDELSVFEVFLAVTNRPLEDHWCRGQTQETLILQPEVRILDGLSFPQHLSTRGYKNVLR